MVDVSQEWLERNFPCKWACPVHTEAGKYVTLVAEGKYREAYAVARERLGIWFVEHGRPAEAEGHLRRAWAMK